MLSITLRRSAATLGVVLAGLLAAAGPASAQMVDGPVLAKAPVPASGLVDYAPGVCYFHAATAPSKADNQSKHELEDCMVSGFTFGQGAIPFL